MADAAEFSRRKRMVDLRRMFGFCADNDQVSD